MKNSRCLGLLDLLLFLILFEITLFSWEIPVVNGECSTSNKFECANGKCIPTNWRCDDDIDCGDHDDSDEQNCEVTTCSSSEFDCGSDQCIPMRWRCDGVEDCENGADEPEDVCAERTCQPNHFDCGQDDTCIPMSWVCDRDTDCTNGQDESNCELQTCSAEEFMCEDRSKCISARWFCDREEDCTDGSDESDCELTTCSSDNFQCTTSMLCIPEDWTCDGDSDCEDESDEAGCPTSAPTCGDGLFMCGNGDCIHYAWRCDGEEDCSDGSDESESENCVQPTCRPDLYQCQDGACVHGYECDGNNDCLDGSDEAVCLTAPPTGCLDTQFTCSNGNCIPSSQENDGIPQCLDGGDEACPSGHKLMDDNTCEDVDECKLGLHFCSQRCENHIGTYSCNCYEGFELSRGTHCKALGDHPLIVYIYHHSIRTYNLTSTENLEVYKDLSHPQSLAIDTHGGLLFWSDSRNGTIMMGSLDGKLKTELVEDIPTVDGIAYDWIHRNLYWSAPHNNSISIMSLDSRHKKTLFNDLDEPRAIVIDPRRSLMYWSDWGDEAKIECAGLDGSERRVIVNSSKMQIEWPNGLTIDYYSDMLFWVDAKHHLLASYDLYSEKFRVILMDDAFLEHPMQLAVFQDVIYWTDWDGHAIRAANKLNGNKLGDIVGSLHPSTPYGIAIWQNSTQPLGENYCEDTSCSHISVPAPGRSCSCLCPDGVKMSSDRVTCVGFLPKPSKPTVTHVNFIPAENKPTVPYDIIDQNRLKVDPPTNHSSNKSSVIWIVLLALVLMTIIVLVIGFFVWRRKASGGKRSMNFDNPVYKKTTDDELFLNSGHTYEHNPGKTSKYQPMIQTDDVI